MTEWQMAGRVGLVGFLGLGGFFFIREIVTGKEMPTMWLVPILASLFLLIGSMVAFTMDEQRKFLALSLNAEVLETMVVGHRSGSSMVIVTRDGTFDLGLNAVEVKGGKSRLVKRAGSAKYELR